MPGWEDELERWLMPFLDRLGHKTRQRICPLYVAGLIGPGDRKSVQPMAERLATGGTFHEARHHETDIKRTEEMLEQRIERWRRHVNRDRLRREQ